MSFATIYVMRENFNWIKVHLRIPKFKRTFLLYRLLSMNFYSTQVGFETHWFWQAKKNFPRHPTFKAWPIKTACGEYSYRKLVMEQIGRCVQLQQHDGALTLHRKTTHRICSPISMWSILSEEYELNHNNTSQLLGVKQGLRENIKEGRYIGEALWLSG